MTVNQKNRKVVILGAGPSGLASADFYLQKGYKVTIIEKTSETGGLARSIDFLGNKYDLGPHTFYSNYSSQTKEFYNRFIGEENYYKIRPSKIIQISDDVLFYSPLRINCAIKMKNLSFFSSYIFYKLLALFSFSTKTHIDKHGYWLKKKIFQPYCKKYFNLSHELVSADFAALLYDSTNNHGDDSVYIPKIGYMGKLWENVSQYLLENGVNFQFNQTVTAIKVCDSKITQVVTQNGIIEDIDVVVSTIPLQLIHQLVFPSSNSKFHLNYRASIIVFLEITALNTNALYLTNYDLENIIGRITFCTNWRTDNSPVIAVEIWCDPNDEIYNKKDSEITNTLVQVLLTIPVIKLDNDPKSRVIKIPKAYPVLEKGYEIQVNNINNDLNTISNLKLIGRHGQFKWDGIDDIINTAYNE